MSIAPVSGGLGAAMAASLRGVQDAGARFADAAGRIAQAGTAPEITPAAPTGSAALLGVQAEPDLTRATVDSLTAQRAYEANLATLRSADEMQQEALRLLG